MKKVSIIGALLVMFLLTSSVSHALLVSYNGDPATGLSGTADFSVSGTELTIVLTNTSTDPFGGGGAAMVLSSINFDLGQVTILGGTAETTAGSDVYTRSGSSWVVQTDSFNLDEQWGFSNTGLGNNTDGFGNSEPFPNADQAVTPHTGGGSSITSFDGGSGVPNGLDYGLLPSNAPVFGNNRDWIISSVTITLDLSDEIDLSFLDNGSYIEFGSDGLYVPGGGGGGGGVIPEPATLAMLGMGLGLGALSRRKRAAA